MKNLNRVHLNGLRALEAVGRLGSLQTAADELGVTVGAVSFPRRSPPRSATTIRS
jgi:hypothetical protein